MANKSLLLLREEGACFYEVLGVARDAGKDEIRRAYRRLALLAHPDKNEDKEQATRDFKRLSHLYGVLTDERKRGIYDRTGSYEESDDAPASFDEAYDYWRDRFRRVTELDIEEYARTYKGSEAEREDLVSAYRKCDGDVAAVFDHVPLSDPDKDQERFVKALEQMIKAGTVPRLAGFDGSKGRRVANRYAHEAEEAEQARRELKLDGGEGALAALIASRKRDRGDAMNALAAKYGGGGAAAAAEDDDPLAGVDLAELRNAKKKKRRSPVGYRKRK